MWPPPTLTKIFFSGAGETVPRTCCERCLKRVSAPRLDHEAIYKSRTPALSAVVSRMCADLSIRSSLWRSQNLFYGLDVSGSASSSYALQCKNRRDGCFRFSHTRPHERFAAAYRCLWITRLGNIPHPMRSAVFESCWRNGATRISSI